MVQAQGTEGREGNELVYLTEVPAGWSLATLIDAFVELSACLADTGPAARARCSVLRRLVELWASQPSEAEAWLLRRQELYAQELNDKPMARPELLSEALLRHAAAECGQHWCGSGWSHFSDSGLRRAKPCGTAADQEYWVAWYLQHHDTRTRCQQLAEELVRAESEAREAREAAAQQASQKRQRLAEEIAERRRLQAELQRSQEECQQLHSRLAEAETRLSEKAQQCEELATRAAAAESSAEEMQKELQQRQLPEEHSKRQEASECAKTKKRLAEAESEASDASGKQRRLELESRSEPELSEKGTAEEAEEVGSKSQLRLEKAVLQERCEQLQQQLAKAEAKLDLMQDLREEIGMYKERLRGLERQLAETRKAESCSLGVISGPTSHTSLNLHGPAPTEAACGQRGQQEPDRASVPSESSSYPSNPSHFMSDAIFKSPNMDSNDLCRGIDLQKGSQVLALDGETVLEVVEISQEGQATEVVDLQAGLATLRVISDHPVQLADEGCEGLPRYVPASKLKKGDAVMLQAGEPVALTGAETQPMECQVLKILFKPDLPAAVFPSPSCSPASKRPKKGPKKKSQLRRSGGGRRVARVATCRKHRPCASKGPHKEHTVAAEFSKLLSERGVTRSRRGKSSAAPMDGGASIPETAAGEDMA
ncbi:unnamed protein product [Symbiodinium natans]|uniref:Uncharacterized protein n=1 Tax=Symbiodinium natans TaxID=878477 RepID=A0A812UYU8_9DINO|nr:unnamed protein product [Symbiodinium natans]